MLKRLLASLLLFISLVAMPAAFAARVEMTPVSPKALRGTIAANAADVVLTAADATNKQQAQITGREMILAYNSSPDTAYTITINSVADSDLGRTGDITAYSLGFGEFALFGLVPIKGWAQTNGKLYFEASNAAIKFVVIRVP